MVKQRAWLAMTSRRAQSRPRLELLLPRQSARAAWVGYSALDGPSKEEQQQQAEQSASKLKAAHGKIDKLTKLVEDLTAEVEELTADLITAKLGQAELA